MPMESPSRPIGQGLFTWPSERPSLLGSRCDHCGAVAFPSRRNCMACGRPDVTIEELPRRGRLWTWTIQRFMPKEPYKSLETAETFEPFGLGYVELPGAVRVETRLTENDPKKLRIGAEMEMTVYVHSIDDDGTRVMNYAFAPVSEER